MRSVLLHAPTPTEAEGVGQGEGEGEGEGNTYVVDTKRDTTGGEPLRS